MAVFFHEPISVQFHSMTAAFIPRPLILYALLTPSAVANNAHKTAQGAYHFGTTPANPSLLFIIAIRDDAVLACKGCSLVARIIILNFPHATCNL